MNYSNEAVKRLGVQVKEKIIGAFVDGLSYQEIVIKTGATLSEVREIISHACAKNLLLYARRCGRDV